MALPLANGGSFDESSPKALEKWFTHLHLRAKPKLTKLHFYVHTANNPTAVLGAPANTVSKASTYFVDDPVTVSPDPNSEIIGRIRGIFCQDDPVLSMSVNIVFTEGKYKGSTISILGNNPISHECRETPILGGTGIFRLARGIATINAVNVDIANKDDILEYNIFVQHY